MTVIRGIKPTKPRTMVVGKTNNQPIRLCAFISLFPFTKEARQLCFTSGHHDVGAPLITLSKQIARQCYIREQLVDIL